MKLEKLSVFQELLITQMNNLIFFPVAMLIATLFRAIVPNTCPRLAIWMLGGLVVFGFYFIRRAIRHFIPLVMLHMIGIGILFYLSLFISAGEISINQTAFMLTGTGFAIYSIYLRLTTDDFKSTPLPMPIAVGITAVGMYLQHYQQNTNWDSYHKLTLILVLACYFINYYIQEYMNFLMVNKNSTGILPEKEIFYSGIQLALLYTISGSVFLLLTAQFSWLKKFLSVLKGMVIRLFRFVFGLFPVTGSENTTPYVAQVVSGDGIPILPTGEPSLFWKVLEVIATILLAAAILFAIGYGLKQFFAFANKMMQKKAGQYTDLEGGNGQDIREKCEAPRKQSAHLKIKKFIGLLDAKERIRQIYKRKVLAFKEKSSSLKAEQLSFYTAREMEQYMEVASFAAIYEKARYSDEECSLQDVKCMKEAFH